MKHLLAKYPKLKQQVYPIAFIIFNCMVGFLILAGCLWSGNLIAKILPITIPGSIIGLLILFFLLTFQIIPTNWIKNCCSLFMRYMTLLFIPAALGIMDNYLLLLDNWLPIIVGSVLSTFIVLILVGFLANHYYKSSDNLNEKENPKL